MTIKDKIKSDPRVIDVWDEGEDGKWAMLKAGFIDGESGCHAIHESTYTELKAKMRYIKPCKCQDCKQNG